MGQTKEQMMAEMAKMAKRSLDLAIEFHKETGETFTEALQVLNLYYKHNAVIDDLLDEIDQLSAIKGRARTPAQNKRIGDAMEEVAFLAFRGVCKKAQILSYQTSGEQIDLDVTSYSPAWGEFTQLIGLPREPRLNLLVECKATEESVSHPTFVRFCHIINTHGSRLGIFFTLEGASGFSDPDGTTRKSLEAAREAQALYHAATKVPVIVLDRRHLRAIKAHTFPVVIAELINEVRRRTGWIGTKADALTSIALPDYLLKHL